MEVLPLPSNHNYSASTAFLKIANRIGGIKCIYDCGSRDALDGLALLLRLNADKLYCFECNPPAIKLCQENIEKYGYIEKAKVVPLAVSDKLETLTFHAIDPEKTKTTHADGNIGASSLLRSNGKYKHETYVQKPIQVETTTLDEYSKSEDSPDLLWLDLQGAEAKALDGAHNVLKKVKIIHVEVSFRAMYSEQALFSDIHDRLKTDFSLEYLDCGRWPQLPSIYRALNFGPWVANAVYVRKQFS